MSKWKNESGSVLVVSALSMTVLLGFVAFATDVGFLLRQRREAQTAADAAAMAAATESLNEGTPTSVTSGMWTVAYHDAVMNGFTPGASNGAANSSTGITLTLLISPNIEISGYNTAGYVQAVVSMKTPTMFMAAFGALRGKDYSSINVSSTAVASNTIQSKGCIYVQNTPTDSGTIANPAVDMNGNSLIAASSCGMTVNGNLAMGGNGSIDSKFVAVSGSYSGKNAGNWFEGVPTQDDPLLKLQDLDNQPKPGTTPGGTCTSPTGSSLPCYYDYNNGNLSGTLPSGIYYFDNLVNNGHGPYVTGTATGSNVTIFLAGNIPLDFNNNGTLCLTPPGFDPGADPCTVQTNPTNNSGTCVGSTDPMCGILIDAPTDGKGGTTSTGTYSCSSGQGNNGNNPGEIYLNFGNTTTVIQGVVYAPYAQLYGQDQGSSTTFNANLVVGNICIQSATFQVNGFSGAWSPLTRVGLVY